MMEIVIKIDDIEYEKIKHDSYYSFDKYVAYIAIKNGTPLPKGHGKLIFEEDMLSVILYSKLFDKAKVREVKEILLKIPTIIEADKEEENETDN